MNRDSPWSCGPPVLAELLQKRKHLSIVLQKFSLLFFDSALCISHVLLHID